MTTDILLIRHAAHVDLGQVLTGRRRDVALSREGLEQATIIADLLGAEPIAAVYSSPRERAYYTAREIADRHELKVRIAEDVDEIDFGEWTGLSFDALEGDPEWQRWNEARGTARPPGGESIGEAADRAARALEHIAHDHPGKTVVCVTHCDVIRAVVARYLGLPFDNLLRFDIDPASVSRLVIGEWGGRLVSLNWRWWLESDR